MSEEEKFIISHIQKRFPIELYERDEEFGGVLYCFQLCPTRKFYPREEKMMSSQVERFVKTYFNQKWSVIIYDEIHRPRYHVLKEF